MSTKPSPKQRSEHYQSYTDTVLGLWKEAMRRRIEATKEMVSFRCLRGDCHVHSTYSDGIGTVSDCKEWMERAGLDFMFITDHNTVRQKVECRRYPNVWWGQEPATEYHHLLILDAERKFRMQGDLRRDYRRVLATGSYPIIAHPVGWFPSTRYAQYQIDALKLLGEEFAIEIINGANNIFDAFDVTDAITLEVWDCHLCRGKKVIAFGNTDAHLPQAIGDVWNGVFVPRAEKKLVLEALRAGHHFVSDAPFMQFVARAEGRVAGMGDTLKVAPGAKVEFSYECADSRGLAEVRLVRNGHAWKCMEVTRRQHVEGVITDRVRAGHSYYRLECFAIDQRRAYANPIYLRA